MARKKKPFEYNQDVVMGDYETVFALTKRKHKKGDLHMFFSPFRVPVGLTDEQVAICALLYPIRRAQVEAYQDIVRRHALDKGLDEVIAELRAANVQLRLPDEFDFGKPMTPARFKRGIYKFLSIAARTI
ncbi:MAG: hypothetical protein RLY66_468 [Candidatus Parcubacteria bacterium]|jgi:hypothetical protein